MTAPERKRRPVRERQGVAYLSDRSIICKKRLENLPEFAACVSNTDIPRIGDGHYRAGVHASDS